MGWAVYRTVYIKSFYTTSSRVADWASISGLYTCTVSKYSSVQTTGKIVSSPQYAIPLQTAEKEREALPSLLECRR